MRIQPFVRRIAGLAALAFCAAAAGPAPARAQNVTVCVEQAVPPGYAVVGAGKGEQCPGYYGSGVNVLTLRVPGDSVTVCTAYTSSLPGYVVTAAGKGEQCPGYYGSGVNVMTLYRPGETVSVCTAYTTGLDGYVVTARGKSEACPGYYGSGTNSATLQRLPQAYVPPPALPYPQAPDVGGPGVGGSGGEAVLERLDEYGRNVLRQLHQAEAELRLGEMTHHPWMGVMGQGAVHRIGVELEPGVSHTVVAVCDQDCASVRVRVIDPRGIVAVVSPAVGRAVVELPPASAGQWTLEASVTDCRVATCRFAVGLFQPPAVSDVPGRRPPDPPRLPPRPRPRP